MWGEDIKIFNLSIERWCVSDCLSPILNLYIWYRKYLLQANPSPGPQLFHPILISLNLIQAMFAPPARYQNVFIALTWQLYLAYFSQGLVPIYFKKLYKLKRESFKSYYHFCTYERKTKSNNLPFKMIWYIIYGSDNWPPLAW